MACKLKIHLFSQKQVPVRLSLLNRIQFYQATSYIVCMSKDKFFYKKESWSNVESISLS